MKTEKKLKEMKTISDKRLQEIIDNRGENERKIMELFKESNEDFEKYAESIHKLLMNKLL